jgi:TRAP transporter TAXI family solute receptor
LNTSRPQASRNQEQDMGVGIATRIGFWALAAFLAFTPMAELAAQPAGESPSSERQTRNRARATAPRATPPREATPRESSVPAPATASHEQLRDRANSNTIGIISGGVDGTYVRIAADLAAVIDRGDQLRILPLLGKGSLQNIGDIIFLRGVDVGIVQSDALTYARRERLYPGVERSLQYITKLYDEELHILAAKDVREIGDLAGKKVNVDLRGSGTAMTASLVFERLGVAIEPTNDDQALALEKLKRGEISALVYVAGRPARLFRDLRAEDGVHFLPVPVNPALLETYLPSRLTKQDYPLVIGDGGSVDTLAVGAVMAVYAWGPGSERYRRVERFVDIFFDNFNSFLQAPRHPKWKEVNLGAQVPGWTRFAAAENWLKRAAAAAATAAANEPARQEFEAFLTALGSGDRRVSDEQKAALFQEFLRWQAQQRQRR